MAAAEALYSQSAMTQTMSNDARDFLPTRRSLLSRLKNGDDQAGWQTFFDTYWKLIYAAAHGRTG